MSRADDEDELADARRAALMEYRMAVRRRQNAANQVQRALEQLTGAIRGEDDRNQGQRNNRELHH